MILPLHDALRSRIREIVQTLYSLDADAVPSIAIESPPNRALGDLAVPVAFELARRLRKPPRAIAQDLAAAFAPGRLPPSVTRVEAAPNGYLNVFLDRPALLREWLSPQAPGPEPQAPSPGKVIVEHTAINPNKAAHIGHLRNSALGDTLVRLLRFRGHPVEVQNYIDDTGVQVADVVVGFRHLEGKGLDDVRRLADSTRFDFYCWDLYARVTDWYEADKERLKIRTATLHDLEHGGNDNAIMAAFIAEHIVRRHLETMARLNIEYDLLTWEGDILRLRFWAHAFETLKRQGIILLKSEGRLAGCWVMEIKGDPLQADEDDQDEDESEDGQREKVIVRSDGTVTYVGKDIAYQFWKFGLLGKDFRYREFDRRRDGCVLWATTSAESGLAAGADGVPRFGAAETTYNVIDTRQTYLQKLLKQALATMGYTREAERAIHFAYEMVALSHATARELGYPADDSGRPFVEVSGRKGLGVKADDLIDRLTEKALVEVRKRNPETSDADARATAETIATAALRYFMVKFTLGKIIIFDIDEALSFEGESGPYLQYAAVRAANIFQKMREREGAGEADVIAALPSTPADTLTAGADADALWGLVLEAARLDEIVEQSLRSNEVAVVAKYAFGLAQAFNAFYHRFPILAEERSDVKRWRAGAAAYFRLQMTRALDLMGCGVPQRM
ncbi:MAG TPA: arginine--tRNA ligase [Vicinamibacterales bacterium]|jgi:arginyl-tRNA synthetase|nr:arginine--tRNA ligase [Vicinamibacterales bacterium]